jgi:hypothetical protein
MKKEQCTSLVIGPSAQRPSAQEMTMKSLIFASAAILVLGAAPASAKTYQWCQRTQATGGNPQCSFTSFRQCQASISGVGGDCIRNPRQGYQGMNMRRGMTTGSARKHRANNAELMDNNGNSGQGDNSLGNIKGGNIGAGK